MLFYALLIAEPSPPRPLCVCIRRERERENVGHLSPAGEAAAAAGLHYHAPACCTSTHIHTLLKHYTTYIRTHVAAVQHGYTHTKQPGRRRGPCVRRMCVCMLLLLQKNSMILAKNAQEIGLVLHGSRRGDNVRTHNTAGFV